MFESAELGHKIDKETFKQEVPKLRAALNAKYEFVHPEHPAINGLSHILWTGVPTVEGAHARNAVFYGDKAIDRSPCGTGTSARMAQLAAKGKLAVGDEFWHESIIGSIFKGRVEAAVTVAGRPATRASQVMMMNFEIGTTIEAMNTIAATP